MGLLFEQIKTVVLMNVLSIGQRGLTTLVTLFSVAVVVGVLLAFLAVSNGFKTTVENSGSSQLGIAMRGGSAAELNSILMNEEVKFLEDAPGIQRDADGPIVSAELYVIVNGIKKSTQSDANLSLRGIGEKGMALRPNVTLSEGRMFEPGRGEVVVGRAITRDYEGFELGNTIRLGKSEWTVVGIFTSNGSVHESEIWADVKTVQSQFNRGNSYQVMRFALENDGDMSAVEEYAKTRPKLTLELQTEREYFASQAQGLKMFIYLGWFLSVLMALGALAGALNAMYTSVAQRTLEIATLRALGFRGFSAFVGTMVESVIIAVVGGLIGTLAAFLFFDGMTGSTLGSTSFTQVVFDFRLSTDSFKTGMIIAVVIGLIGGFFPALKAARIPVVKAFSLQH